jgi:carboxyl-terminal processing protease
MKKFFLRHFPALLLGTALGVLIAATHGVFADRSTQSRVPPLPVDELHTFTEIFTRIKEDYVEEVSDKQLVQYAIEGMLSGLDPHSAYLNPEAYKEMQIGTSGEFGGLGIEVNMEDGFVKVVSPIDDTPAQRAGVKAGDVIVKIDQTPVKGLSLNDAVKMMRGKVGSEIVLSIVREGQEKPLQITIVRDIIQVKSVKSRLLEPGYGFVRISQFQNRTTEDLAKALADLKRENNGDLRGLVLDLRNNPGGVLQAAVGVADTFLEKGLIVYTEGRVKDSQMKFKAKPKDLLEGAPLVVLVNGGSASASEIVAGALQDHKRAIIMGTRTFGKGSVQTIQPISNDSAIKITTARYFTPLGRSIQAEGIKPDITLNKVEISSVEAVEEATANNITEADLRGHLANPKGDKETLPPPTIKSKKSSPKDKESKDDKKEPLAKADYALYEALNLLKGLSIVNVKTQ